MGLRRRQLREELERREKGVAAAEGSGGLGAGGEARVAAAQLDELQKRGEALREKQSRARDAAWDTARASASKKRRASSGSAEASSAVHGGDDDIEERTVRVKWSTKKESHSDHTLDVLFSRFGAVESVSIEAGTGNKALVTFGSAPSADAAVEAYRDNGTMRASYIGKRKPKRSAFAQRRHTMTPNPHQRQGTAAGDGAWAAGVGDSTINSFRDQESLVMMKLRQEAERQALTRKMAEEDGTSVAGNGARSGAIPVTPRRDAREEGSGGVGAAGAGTGKPGVASAAKSTNATRSEGEGGDAGVSVQPVEIARGQNIAQVEVGGSRERKGGDSLSGHRFGGGGSTTPFSVPPPSVGRESDILAAMLNGGVAGGKRLFPTGATGGSKSVPTTPMSVKQGRSRVGVVDEGDILARMMAMKR